jgi:SRF-type transcription factor (DNA-binding and dimerisation domain)
MSPHVLPSNKHFFTRMALVYKYVSYSVNLRFFSTRYPSVIYNYYSDIAINKSKRRSENLRRRKETLLKKVYELGRDYGVDVALILR